MECVRLRLAGWHHEKFTPHQLVRGTTSPCRNCLSPDCNAAALQQLNAAERRARHKEGLATLHAEPPDVERVKTFKGWLRNDEQVKVKSW